MLIFIDCRFVTRRLVLFCALCYRIDFQECTQLLKQQFEQGHDCKNITMSKVTATDWETITLFDSVHPWHIIVGTLFNLLKLILCFQIYRLQVGVSRGQDIIPLSTMAKRYRVRASEKKKAFQNDVDAILVLALHLTSFHKEIWEPTLEALLQVLEETSDSARRKIRQVRAVNCSNHGHAEVLN